MSRPVGTGHNLRLILVALRFYCTRIEWSMQTFITALVVALGQRRTHSAENGIIQGGLSRFAALGSCPNSACGEPICLQAHVVVLSGPHKGVEDICGPIEMPYYIDLADQLA
jgi:hypothetical protein